MDKLNKTDEPCNCGVISTLLNDLTSGFKLSQNSIVFETESSFWMVYHCIFCGGRLPDGSKPIWYPRLDEAEMERLQQLVAGIETPEAAIERLGPPDYESKIRTLKIHEPTEEELAGEPHSVEYYHLSEHANVEFYFNFGEPHTTSVNIELKNIPPRHLESD